MSRTRLGMLLLVVSWVTLGANTHVRAEWGYDANRSRHGHAADFSRDGYRAADARRDGSHRRDDIRMATRHPYGPPAAARSHHRYEMPVGSSLGGNRYHHSGRPGVVPVVPVSAYRPVVTPAYAAPAACPPTPAAPVHVNVQAGPSGPGLEAGYYIGRGIIGQPTVYADGQPVRNFLRAFAP